MCDYVLFSCLVIFVFVGIETNLLATMIDVIIVHRMAV